MLRLFGDLDIKWMSYRKLAYAVSGLLIVVSIISLVAHGGPRLSVDFTGGTVIEAKVEPPQSAETIRTAAAKADIGSPEIQSIGGGGQYLFRLGLGELKTTAFPKIKEAIESTAPGTTVTLLKEETVGPKIGSELRTKAIWAVLIAMAGILIYVGWRYEFMMALGAIIALFHDVLLTVGFISVLNIELSLTVLAALLTIAGYSINDTIVVYDRVREQSRLLRRENFQRVIDISVNQTLSRTLLTGISVTMTIVAIIVWGGEVIRDFGVVMLFGTVLGTYSSVYVASALALDIRGPETTRLRGK
ncbi:MAG: protein translocase subunit SecF [Candidatus Eisenbacteria bacterium]|nr:protein translocase subunit SecF [Candidatus Eisenbacteria bacterium]